MEIFLSALSPLAPRVVGPVGPVVPAPALTVSWWSRRSLWALRRCRRGRSSCLGGRSCFAWRPWWTWRPWWPLLPLTSTCPLSPPHCTFFSFRASLVYLFLLPLRVHRRSFALVNLSWQAQPSKKILRSPGHPQTTIYLRSRRHPEPLKELIPLAA